MILIFVLVSFVSNLFSVLSSRKKSYVSDSTAAILIVFSMFLFPSERPFILGGKRTRSKPNCLLFKENAFPREPYAVCFRPIASLLRTYYELYLLHCTIYIS